MRDDDLCFLSVSEMAILLRERAVSSVELVEAHVGRIERLDDALRAFITVFADQARSTARLADEALAAGNDRRPLLGVPVAIKDEAGAAGFPGTFGCLALSEDVVQRDAVHTQRLRDAGAVVLGATNLPEFGHRGTTINRLRGATSTPFAVGMNAGGSSGGSAAAVASGMASVAHGSDGGGSVRIPAAMCGVVGFIGTYGRVPRVTRPDAYGGRGNFSYDGVLARSVRDAITTLRVMSGYDPRDPFSISSPVPLWEIPDVPARGIRVGWTADFNAFPMEQDVAERAWETVALLRSSGAHVDEVSIDLGYTGDEIAAICSRYISIGNAVRAVALSKRGFDLTGALRDLVDERILAHIDEGRRITAVDAKLDDIARSRILDSFRGGFEQFDVLISPTVAIPGISNAQASEQPGPNSVAGQSVDPFLGWALTVPVNFCGYPSMSVPAGRVYGLPIGIQIVAPHGREDLCIRVAAAVEELAPWKHTYLDARRALDTVSAHLEAADLPPS